MLDRSNWKKILFCTDNHLCPKSSVISGRGEKFSDRLENQIECIRWVDSFGLPVIHLGDFMNNSTILAEDQFCIDELKPYIKEWVFLRGNHEYSGNFDVLGALGGTCIRVPTEANLGGLKTLFLPFNSEEKDIQGHYDLILGHIGLEGIPFGAKGFKPELIENSCEIFLNGHLHNRHKIGFNKWNMGSLTAQNFSDDCLEYRKGIVILDTEKRSLEFIENPYAYNFYKFTWEEYLRKYKDTAVGEAIRGSHSCISMSCKAGDKAKIIDYGEFSKVYYLRISEEIKPLTTKEEVKLPEQIDHLQKFRSSFIERAGESELVLSELGEVLK